MFTFCKANKSIVPKLQEWFQKPYIIEYWGADDYTWNNLVNNVIHGKKDLFDYWIASYGKEYEFVIRGD